MKVAELFEAPQFVMPTSFNLDNKAFNSKFASDLLSRKRKHLISTLDETTHLYEFNTGYAVIDNSVPEVLYYVRFKVARISYVGKPCIQQVRVWRNPLSPKVVDTARDIFFGYLLPKFGCLVTDTQQTEGEKSGQTFWIRRIGDAFNRNLYVYFVSVIPQRMIKQVHNAKEFREIMNNAWGWDHKYQAKRIIISDSPLQEKSDITKP